MLILTARRERVNVDRFERISVFFFRKTKKWGGGLTTKNKKRVVTGINLDHPSVLIFVSITHVPIGDESCKISNSASISNDY